MEQTFKHDQARAGEAWLAVVRAYNECAQTMAKQLEPLGLSLLEHEMLMNLRASPGLTQQALSERCFSAKSGISMLVARMEKAGLVRRMPSTTDRRARCLTLTAEGVALADRAAGVQARIAAHMADLYAPDELEALHGRMDALSQLLREMRA